MLEKLLAMLVLAAILGQLKRGRELTIMAVSVLAVFLLQPNVQPPNLTFWLPVLILVITVTAWFLTASPEVRGWRQNWLAGSILVGITLLVDLNRYFELQLFNTTTPRPQLLLALVIGLALVFMIVATFRSLGRQWLALLLFVIMLLFVAIKLPATTEDALIWLMRPNGNANEPVILVIRWLGFSYIAFRLIHTIRDCQTGKLPSVTLSEYVSYVFFFPSLIAGPIDRLEHFVSGLREPLPLGKEDWVFIIQRIFWGFFQKFVLADALAVSALNDRLALQVTSTPWMWIMVYAYAFQIFFDFSGYTDIAIGMGRLMGIRLPDNFLAPYLKPNITQFWNNWHITLTQWFRTYFFYPLNRSLRQTKFPGWAILALTQVSTMVLIGLWHGVTWNYVLWGLWQGLGLFIHNRWTEWQRIHTDISVLSPFRQTVLTLGGTLFTFHFVALGWIFFALSTPELSWRVIRRLFGI